MTAFLSRKVHVVDICNWLCGVRVPGMMASATGIAWVKPFLSKVDDINVAGNEGNVAYQEDARLG